MFLGLSLFVLFACFENPSLTGKSSGQTQLYHIIKLDKPVYKQHLTSSQSSNWLIRQTKQAFAGGPVKWRQWQRRDSNQQPLDYESNALFTVPRDPSSLQTRPNQSLRLDLVVFVHTDITLYAKRHKTLLLVTNVIAFYSYALYSTSSQRSSLICGFGAVVHLAPPTKYSLRSDLQARYSKNRLLHAIGLSIISSPITRRISRGIAACNPTCAWNYKYAKHTKTKKFLDTSKSQIFSKVFNIRRIKSISQEACECLRHFDTKLVRFG